MKLQFMFEAIHSQIGLQPQFTLGPAYNEFGYYKHPA